MDKDLADQRLIEDELWRLVCGGRSLWAEFENPVEPDDEPDDEEEDDDEEAGDEDFRFLAAGVVRKD